MRAKFNPTRQNLLRALVGIPFIGKLKAQSLSMSIGPTVSYNDQFSGQHGQPNTGRYSDHDSTVAAWSADGNMYVTANDGWGPNNVLFGSSGRNLFLTTIAGWPNGATETLINSMDDFGSITQLNTNGWTDGASWKSSGLDCQDGVMYLWVYRQTYPPVAGSYGTNGSFVVSHDNGATWCRPARTNHTTGACTGAPSATGDAPQSPEAMLGAATGILGLYPMQYAQDGQWSLPPVDQNTTYKYFFADASDLLHVYLLRVLLTDYPKLDSSLYQYWTGSGWSSSASAKAAILSGCNSKPFYIPALGIYVASSTDVATGLSTFYKASTITGPYTSLMAIPNDPAVGQVFFTPLLKSLATVGSVTTVYYESTGGFQNRTSDPNTNKYAPQFNLITIGTPSPIVVTGSVSMSGKVTAQ